MWGFWNNLGNWGDPAAGDIDTRGRADLSRHDTGAKAFGRNLGQGLIIIGASAVIGLGVATLAGEAVIPIAIFVAGYAAIDAIKDANHAITGTDQNGRALTRAERVGAATRAALTLVTLGLAPGIKAIREALNKSREPLPAPKPRITPDQPSCPQVRVASYDTLTDELAGTGQQANHLNQDAAFRDVIPTDQGLANAMRGDAITEPGTPHFQFHESLEEFWAQYRKGGDRYGTTPTNAEYGAALERALISSGYSSQQAADLAAAAARQRAEYGLAPSAPVPRVPGRLPQAQPR
jgi:hypothetical protein